jgi:hypothetical protein
MSAGVTSTAYEMSADGLQSLGSRDGPHEGTSKAEATRTSIHVVEELVRRVPQTNLPELSTVRHAP